MTDLTVQHVLGSGAAAFTAHTLASVLLLDRLLSARDSTRKSTKTLCCLMS